MARPALPRWLAALALVAFFLQGLAVQTHIHGVPMGPAHGARLSAPVAPPDADPFASCALCQEALHAGHALTPILPVLALLPDWTPAAPLSALRAVQPATHRKAWNSRAPPQL